MSDFYATISAASKLAMSEIRTEGFKRFVTSCQTHDVAQNLKYLVSVESELGLNLFAESPDAERRSKKIKLGKTIMNEIESERLVGLNPEKAKPGKPQIYNIEGKVEFLTPFYSAYGGRFSTFDKILEQNKNSDNDWCYVKCFSSDIDEEHSVNIEFLDISGGRIHEPLTRVVNRSFFKKNNITEKEYWPIIELLAGYEKVLEYQNFLQDNKKKNLCFVPEGAHLIAEICERHNTNILEEYVEFIKKHFYDFRRGSGFRELPFYHCIMPLI